MSRDYFRKKMVKSCENDISVRKDKLTDVLPIKFDKKEFIIDTPTKDVYLYEKLKTWHNNLTKNRFLAHFALLENICKRKTGFRAIIGGT